MKKVFEIKGVPEFTYSINISHWMVHEFGEIMYINEIITLFVSIVFNFFYISIVIS